MKYLKNKHDIVATIFLIAALAIITTLLVLRIRPGDTEKAAAGVEHTVKYRMDLLEQYVETGQERIPEDMVIYKYYNDSLIFWSNRFPTNNDNIGKKIFLPRLSDPRASVISPLSEIGDSVCFCNIGPKMYLAKAYVNRDMKTIAALEIDRESLKLTDGFFISDLSSDGGSSVRFNGRPMFKVEYDSMARHSDLNATLVWIAYLLITAAMLILLFTHKTLKQYLFSTAIVVAATLAVFLWGKYGGSSYTIFSPSLYSGGTIISSLGSAIIVNLLIFLLVHGLYMSKSDLYAKLNKRLSMLVFKVFIGIALVGIAVFSATMLKSIIIDSSISTELYQIGNVTNWTVLIYISFILLLSSIPMLLKVGGFNAFKKGWIVGFSCAVALYLVFSTSLLSFRKEQARIESLAGNVEIPSGYNYARYIGTELVSFKGSYPYSTVMSRGLADNIYQDGEKVLRYGGYTHFINRSGGNAVIISRKSNGPVGFFVSFIIVSLAQFLVLSLLASEGRKTRKRKNHYTTRINVLLTTSLSVTMITIVSVSIYLVTRSKMDNITAILSEKVASVQTMVQREVGPEFAAKVREISADTDSDISIYSRDGRLLINSTPATFEKSLEQYRIDREAYEQIVKRNRRYYIQRERQKWGHIYKVYAPVFGNDKKITAILSFPYSGDETYYLERDAILHTIGMISLFIIFLLLARVAGTRIINRIFMPLNKMSLKMEAAGLDSLEPIKYDRDDEISGLVNAYNGMIETLISHSRQMAQIERDRAWSEMARQVAHEIKNPLTPMKLQLQRIIRQKQKGDPAWQDNFDEMSKVILDHVDILTDTANEFSNFAKLYNEPHTDINLDALLKEEIAMFDNKGNLSFTYIGLNDTIISGPKPQLTRVFVNIINNAVQAVSDKKDGQILVTLRKGATPGYEISIEDNGEGVPEENVDKLFKPNFTTKNGGSGLGLAISRSILETCGASISYCRSFSLGGACFRIIYPEN